jgi:transcriptional regulator with XRE-family HTH domain
MRTGDEHGRLMVGHKVRELREERRMSQTELAERAGISRVTVNRVENGHLVPSATTVVQLAGALDVDPGELFAFPLEDSEAGARQMSIPRIREWLVSKDVSLLIMSEGRFVETIVKIDDPDEIQELHSQITDEREKVEGSLYRTQVRKRLFPSAQSRSRDLGALRREISQEHRQKERALFSYSRYLFEEGKAEGFLSRGEVPPYVLEQTRKAREKVLREALIGA